MNFDNIVNRATAFSYKGSTIFRYTEPFSEEVSEVVAITKCARYNLISTFSAMRFEEIPPVVFSLFENYGLDEALDASEIWFSLFDELVYLFTEGGSYDEIVS